MPLKPAALVTIISGLLAVGPAAFAANPPKTQSKEQLRGMSWDSIKSMPDFGRGMWTPGARPPTSTLPAQRPPSGEFGGGFGGNVPFTPKYKAMNDARMQRVRGQGAGGQNDIPLSNSGFCIPGGVPGNMMLVSHEYAFKPGLVIMLLENSEVRRIFTDGRGHPPDDESNPSFQGHSIGHWEGDTLVVETAQIYPESELFFGMTVTEKTIVKERISLVEKDTLQIDTVVEDDELFTKPWTYTRYYRRDDREAVEYEPCTLADRAIKVGDKLMGIDFNPNREKPGQAGDKK
jgi:hypothetical protein